MAAAARCSGDCLSTLPIGSCAPGRRTNPPPRSAKAVATQRESWLEEEVARLLREELRLQELNEELRAEFGIQEPKPAASREKYGASLRDVARANPDETIINMDTEGEETATHEPPKLVDQIAQLVEGGEQSPSSPKGIFSAVQGQVNRAILKGSALSRTTPVQAAIYLIALGGVIFVLVATSLHLGAHDHGHDDHGHAADHAAAGHGADHGDHAAVDMHGHGRRLGGAASPLMKNIACTLTAVGLMSLIMNYLKQPLIIGYLLAGALVGPVGLNIVESHMAISELSSLGLIFFLFMIGLELNMKSVRKMSKVDILVGVFQFPVCGIFMSGVFILLQAAGLAIGSGKYAPMYCAVGAALSSRMIVTNLMGAKHDIDTPAARLVSAILVFQDLWVVVMLALQDSVGHLTFLDALQHLAMLVALIVGSLVYAKFVVPAALYTASKSVELMLVLSLAWCFFVCTAAVLPFVGLPMELAALVAGMALATFPFSSEFHSKIKYIRDFFFTLFFSGIGMMIPIPRLDLVFSTIAVTSVALLSRWLGVSAVVKAAGGGTRLGTLATLNLSQIGETALVIAALGLVKGQIDDETLEVLMFSFLLLAFASYYVVTYSNKVHQKAIKLYCRVRGLPAINTDALGQDDGEPHEIVLLGFHKVAFMLVAELKEKAPELLRKLHVIDFNKAIFTHLKEMGILCTYGDIGAMDVLRDSRTVQGTLREPRLCICAIPDELLQGVTNKKIVRRVKAVWQNTKIIVTAEGATECKELYDAGADFVLAMAKLSAVRIHELLQDHFEHGSVQDLFELYRNLDKEDATALTKTLGNKI